MKIINKVKLRYITSNTKDRKDNFFKQLRIGKKVKNQISNDIMNRQNYPQGTPLYKENSSIFHIWYRPNLNSIVFSGLFKRNRNRSPKRKDSMYVTI